MHFERIVSDGVAQHGYFIAEGGEAVVVDPRRDVDVFLRLARETGSRILTVCETHRNEDVASGAPALAALTGAEVLHSGSLDFEYGTAVEDGHSFGAGRLRFSVLETPGHTDESLSFAVVDPRAAGAPFAVFTGDALLAGDTGRVDLYGEAEERRLAEALHASVYQKLLPLGDGVLLYPAHGSGSVCGGAIADRHASTLGFERLHNASLHEDRSTFVKRKRDERHVVPPYFRRMELWNRTGEAPSVLPLPAPPPIAPGELLERMLDGAVVVDARSTTAFAGGHIPGSLSIWRDGLSAYLGWMVEPGTDVLLVLPEEADLDAVTRTLMRIGYDEVRGVLRGGFQSWQNEGRPIGSLGTVDADTARRRLRAGKITLVDVRTPAEHRADPIDGALPIFVGELEGRLGDIPRDRPVVTLCAVGHRGSIAASVLARHGFPNVSNVLGGATAWSATA